MKCRRNYLRNVAYIIAIFKDSCALDYKFEIVEEERATYVMPYCIQSTNPVQPAYFYTHTQNICY